MKMKVDLTCPVEMFSYDMTGNPVEMVSLTLFNLSDKIVTSVQTTLVLHNEEGTVTGRYIERIMGLKGASRQVFNVSVPLQSDTRPDTIEVQIEKVWFDDSFVWRRSNNPMTTYDFEPIQNPRALEMLRYLSADDALCYPREDKFVWVCICGRANEKEMHECKRCGRTHDDVFRRFNKEAIEAVVEQREKELEDKAMEARKAASDIQTMREKEYESRKKANKHRSIIATVLVIVLVGGYLGLFHLLPYIRYHNADSLLQAQEYDAAKAAFADLEDYRDAKAKVLDCDVKKAQSLIAEGSIESLQKAQDIYRSLADDTEMATMVDETQYLIAQRYLTSGDYLEAGEAFTALGDYRDSVQLSQQARYEQARELSDMGSFEESRQIFLALGDYQDAKEQANECLYQPAQRALSDKNFSEAQALLMQIPDYLDAKELLVKAYYNEAEAYFLQGEYQKAGEKYLQCGDYEDAKVKAGDCLYEQALLAFNKGEYVAAFATFQQLGTYKESAEKYKACAYQLGIQALGAGAYDDAYDYFEPINGYLDVGDKLNEVIYHQALTALDNKSYDDAIALFQKTSYQDSAAKMKEATAAKAEQLLTENKWDEGIDLYKSIGTDVEETVKTKTYERAQELITDTDYEKALALLLELGDYDGATEAIQKVRYQMAKDALENNQIAEAMSQLELLGDYQDAKTLLNDIRYRQAEELLSQGETVKAAQLYALLGNYLDAQSKSASAYATHYAAVSQAVKEAFEKDDFQLVIDTLGTMDAGDVPEEYQSLAAYYQEACYKVANALYNEGKPYQALPYYRAIEDYKDVKEAKLSRNAYKIIGAWANAKGDSFVFNEDGTCTLNGESMAFSVRNYSISTGVALDALSQTHHISRLTSTDLTLRDQRDKTDVVYKLQRQED